MVSISQSGKMLSSYISAVLCRFMPNEPTLRDLYPCFQTHVKRGDISIRKRATILLSSEDSPEKARRQRWAIQNLMLSDGILDGA
jgi:hypothetical protein